MRDMEGLSGTVLTEDGFIDGYICIENGIITEISEGKCPCVPVSKGLIVPPLVNSHTHCADGGLKISPDISLDELVAPPNGLKHQYLRNLTDTALFNNMRHYSIASSRNGAGTFVDFREGGLKGCRILKAASPEATILGRPVSEEYDPNEIDDILEIADGIGISGISDMDHNYVDAIADHVRKKKKIFAIHASEKVREDIDMILSLDPAFVVHMVEATDSDLLKCAETETPVIICARSNRYFGKVPPIKRILDCGVDIGIGTDNAMLCEPDLRAEASVFRDTLTAQGGCSRDLVDPLFLRGRKILYPGNKIHLKVGMKADVSIMPYSGKFSIDKVLNSNKKVIRYPIREERPHEFLQYTYTD